MPTNHNILSPTSLGCSISHFSGHIPVTMSTMWEKTGVDSNDVHNVHATAWSLEEIGLLGEKGMRWKRGGTDEAQHFDIRYGKRQQT